MKNTVVSGVLLLIAAGLLSACAEERAPIDRVQPYALPKTFFIGEDFNNADDDPEFYTQNTLIDVGYGAMQDALFTNTYAQPTSRIKWQITEGFLIARASYERIIGSDGKGVVTGLETQDGIIAAVFPIQSHFDIVNSYNSTTGEKYNVVEENSYDRPWYEREYIRVSWSTNLATENYDFDTLSLVGVYGSVHYEPLSFYVENPYDEEAPVFDLDNGYFDVTSKAYATPGLIDLGFLGWGIDKFPACYLDPDFMGGTSPVGSCNSVELTMRHSFRQVVDNDFQPMHHDGWRFQAFGGFAFAERRGYNREYGMTDELHHRFLSRFQLWDRAHYYTDPETMEGPIRCYIPEDVADASIGEKPYMDGDDIHADENGDGTEDACEAVTTATGLGGSKCDEFSQKCTLPFRARTPLVLPWYYTNDSDPLYYDASNVASNNWDASLRGAVRAAQYAECVDTGGVQADCARDWPMYFGGQEDIDDLIALVMEMDDCRSGKTYESFGEPWSEDRISSCNSQMATVGADRQYKDVIVNMAQMEDMIVLCHSPVQFDDHPSCAPEDQRLPADVTSSMCREARAAGDQDLMDTCMAALTARLGDLRYHQVNVIEAPQTPSPWGIMVSSIDPTNGQTISSSSNVWSWVNAYWGQRLVDYMRFAAGELTAAEVTEAEFIDDWSAASEAASKSGRAPMMTKEEVDRRVNEFVKSDPTQTDGEVKVLLDQLAKNKELEAFTRKLKGDMSGVMADSSIANGTSFLHTARMADLAENAPEMEAALMNPAMKQLYGAESLPLSDTILDLVSPIRGGNPALQREFKRMKHNALAKRGMCELGSDDVMGAAPGMAINGLTEIMQAKFGAFNAADSKSVQNDRAERMVRYIAERVHMSVMVHEMGHAVAHRHNFVSSSDAYNYRPQYWQLRTKNGTIQNGNPAAPGYCSNLSADGESCVGPRWYDPKTPNEDNNLIEMWMHSSVMEYAGEPTQDFLGLGAWDMAATRLFYGDTAPVYKLDYADMSAAGVKKSIAQAALVKMDNFGGIVGYSYKLGAGDGEVDLHYSQLNSGFGLISDCYEVDPQAYKPAIWDEDVDGVWNPVLDGQIVSIDGTTYTRCRQPEVDYVPWNTLRPPTSDEIPKFNAGTANEFTPYIRAMDDDQTMGWILDKQGRIRVPYGFASDGWADIGNAAVYRHDNGADSYEIFGFMMSEVELNHIWNNYRRGRQTFTLSGSFGRETSRYFDKMRDGAKGLALQRNWIEKIIGPEVGLAGSAYWTYAAKNFWPNSVLASTLVFDYFTKISQRPAIGPHAYPWANGIQARDYMVVFDGDNNWSSNTAAADMVVVPNGAFAPVEENGNTYGSFSMGGRLVENQLDDTQGDYTSGYTVNCGSYYSKAFNAMMLTESVDNFISDSRGDFLDSRYRATAIADLFPDGYRRWLAHNLTNDKFMTGARMATDASGNVLKDANNNPMYGIGWTKWWGDTVESCFPKNGTTICGSPAQSGSMNLGESVAGTAPMDPQSDWETQKYLVSWTYIYNQSREEFALMENDMQDWRDMLWLYDMAFAGDEVLEMENRIEFHHPEGRAYIARTYGTEDVFGRTVQRGVAARVLEYSNELLQAAYETTPVCLGYTDNVCPGAGETPDWYEAVLDADGRPIVRFDPTISSAGLGTSIDCTATDNSECTCDMNSACLELQGYRSVLDWLWAWSGFGDRTIWGWNDMEGVYGG